MDQIIDIKESGNHITDMLSLADLIQMGGYTAVEYCGGPTMNFRIGRADAESEDQVSDEHLLQYPDDPW